MPKIRYDAILNVPPYVPGKGAIDGVERVIKLSANENPFGASDKAVDAMQAAAVNAHRYPDGGCVKLREALGKLHNIDPAQIVCGAGSDEIFEFLCRAYAGPGDEVVVSRHGFLMYAISAQRVGASVVYAQEENLTTSVDEILGAVSDNTKLVFIANPNNPTGTYINAAELQRLRDGLPEEVILVIDNAYAEYVTAEDYSDGHELVARSHTVCTRTFSKAYGLGGARVGWGYMPAEVADVMNRMRGPFNVSSIGQAGAIAALDDQAYIAQCVQHNTQWREKLTDAFSKSNYNVIPSQANFVLVDCGDEDAAVALYETLQSAGIITRQMQAYGLPTALRITIGTAEECEALLSVL